MLKEIQAPNPVFIDEQAIRIFLAGSIEMGKAEPWRKRLISKIEQWDVTILNPRRDDWDSSWVQSINNKQFKEQVEWELEGLEIADMIIVYFDPKTTSPIMLLELGLFGNNGKVLVCCPDGYYRKGNVEIVCDRYDILFVHTFQDMMKELESYLNLNTRKTLLLEDEYRKAYEMSWDEDDLKEKSENPITDRLDTAGKVRNTDTGELVMKDFQDE